AAAYSAVPFADCRPRSRARSRRRCADEAAGWLGTISYEVVCMISPRVPRVYVEDK
ncbi:MAG: hypothetical protein II790_08490, partial [Schwartzia sp.]|nr:hypothetical protein [Schwartzia sp. (in: firmicutes)]